MLADLTQHYFRTSIALFLLAPLAPSRRPQTTTPSALRRSLNPSIPPAVGRQCPAKMPLDAQNALTN